MRDPGVFEDDDGRVYLFYCGQGEDAIGLAQLHVAPVISGDVDVVKGRPHTFSVGCESDVTPGILRISESDPVVVDFHAEGTTLPFTYSGSGGYPVLQNQTAAAGTNGFQLAHLAFGDVESLTFPDRYYALPGASLDFQSLFGSATAGQVAAVQVSFDNTLWQTIWIRTGGDADSAFSEIHLALDGLAGRIFGLRFCYTHEAYRDGGFVSGSASNQGWFIDDVRCSGLEAEQVLDDLVLTNDYFTLAEITPSTCALPGRRHRERGSVSPGREGHQPRGGDGIRQTVRDSGQDQL